MRKRTRMVPRTDAGSFGKFVTRLVTGNPITEDISPIAGDRNKKSVPLPGTPEPAKPHEPNRPAHKRSR